jgi:hypothetical protein
MNYFEGEVWFPWLCAAACERQFRPRRRCIRLLEVDFIFCGVKNNLLVAREKRKCVICVGQAVVSFLSGTPSRGKHFPTKRIPALGLVHYLFLSSLRQQAYQDQATHLLRLDRRVYLLVRPFVRACPDFAQDEGYLLASFHGFGPLHYACELRRTDLDQASTNQHAWTVLWNKQSTTPFPATRSATAWRRGRHGKRLGTRLSEGYRGCAKHGRIDAILPQT